MGGEARALGEIGLEERLRRLELVHRIGVALAGQSRPEALVETILLEAKKLCNADGGTLYLRSEDDAELGFAIVRNDSLGLTLGGTTGAPIDFPPVALHDADGAENHQNVASHALWKRDTVNIADAYDTEEFDFSGTKRFDAQNGYRSQSFLTIPMLGSSGRVIGVLQLINAADPATGKVHAFPADDQHIVEALAAQAGVTLDNQLLIKAQKELLESFIQLIAAAIDAKSPYTGGHCERVPLLTEMLAQAACEADAGPFASFGLDDDEWYELRIAAWLHDCGKVVTPIHVMDKATKLEAIYDRIETVRARYGLLKQEAELQWLRDGKQDDQREAYEAKQAELDEELAFLEKTNIGGEFLNDEAKLRVRTIAKRTFPLGAERLPLLTWEEVANLTISRGTLTDDERLTINGHMVQTISMLEALPFPRNLRRVPEYAAGHHEKMDGGGYPKGIYAADMSVPARIMAIADVFEALTAQDRPYKKGKTLSESMRIMGFMKRDNHLDPELLDLFVSSGTYRAYGKQWLPPELIDEVDEQAILDIEPRPYELPAQDERRRRVESLLPEYEVMRTSVPTHMTNPPDSE